MENIRDSQTSVSVVISTCDRPAKLKRAIASVLRQSYQNWQLYVVGDFCGNETVQAVESFADSRIAFFNTDFRYGKEDHGSAPKNLGIESSSGELIAYLDDDDEFEPGHLAESVSFLSKHPEIDLVYGCSKVFKFIDPLKFVIRDRPWEPELHEKSPFINTCEIVHRRKLLSNMEEGRWKTVGYYNDYDFLKRASKAGRFGHSNHIAATQHFPHAEVLKMERQRLRRRNQRTPRLSVIVGVRGRTEYLRQCIASLNNQDCSKEDFEVIVVDQGHGNDSSPLTSLFSGRIMHIALDDEGPFHRGWVCNVGAKASSSDVFCFLDCDCVVRPDFVRSVLALLPRHDYMLRLRRKWLPQELTASYFSGKISYTDAYQACDLDSNTNAVGSGMCVNRDAFFRLRGFDESYDQGWGFEDVDLRDRFVASGIPFVEDDMEPLQMHLWHETQGHDRVHRGDHYHYYKKMNRLMSREAQCSVRNNGIDWGSIPREK